MKRVEVVGYRERTRDGHLRGRAESGLLEKGSKHGRMQKWPCAGKVFVDVVNYMSLAPTLLSRIDLDS